MRCFGDTCRLLTAILLPLRLLTAQREPEPTIEGLQEQVRLLQEELRTLRTAQGTDESAITVDATGTALVQKRFLSRATQGGLILVPSHLRRFSLDVGFNQGLVTVGDWLLQKHCYDAFIVGVEANPYLYTLFDRILSERQHPFGYEGLFWHAADSPCIATAGDATITHGKCKVGYAADTARRARIFRNYSDTGQLLLVHGAASTNLRGVADFSIGLGWSDRQVISDVGSLFGFTKNRGKALKGLTAPVATLRLADILARVPPPPGLHWDTLKIDIQGADADALLSAREYLPRFMCVLGEFKTTNYDVPAHVETNPKDMLTGAGFHLLHRDAHSGQLWINMRFRSVFESYVPGDEAHEREAKFTCTASTGGRNGGKTSRSMIAQMVRALPKVPSRGQPLTT